VKFVLRSLTRLTIAVCCALSARAAAENPTAPAELRVQAEDRIKAALKREQKWVKVHAAEFMLSLGYSELVRDTFSAELKLHEHEPQYRVGIFRVLAKAAPNDRTRAAYQDRIAEIFVNRDAPDRLHAIEAIAKLGIRVPDESQGRSATDLMRALTREVHATAADVSSPMRVYALWVLANSKLPGAEAALAHCLESAALDDRLNAAYALRFQQSVQPETLSALKSAALAEKPGSAARVYVASAAFVHQGAAPTSCPFRDVLVESLRSGTSDERVEACISLARSKDGAVIPLLSGVFNDPTNTADTQIAAAAGLSWFARSVPLRLAVLDWVVIAIYAAGMIGIGWWFSRRNRNSDDYLLGGRSMSPFAVGLSLLMISTISYLAMPGEMIKHGPMVLSQFLAYPFIAIAVGWFLIPCFMKLRVTSAYEILETRLGPGIRTLGALMFLSLRLIWMALIVHMTTSHVIIPLTGVDPRWAPLLSAALAVITMIYTSLGGMHAVVWADVVQSLILLLGAAICIAMVTIALGGFGEWWPDRWVESWSPPSYGFESDARISLGWMFVSCFCWYVSTAGSDQMSIQRYLSTRDVKAARRAFVVSLIGDALITVFLAGVGLALLAYLRVHPEVLPVGETVSENADNIFPRFIVLALPVGIAGIVIASLLAAAMSNLAAGLNSASSVIKVDFIDKHRVSASTGRQQVSEAKWISALLGAVVIGLSLVVGMISGNLLEVAFKACNLLVTPLFILFFCALFIPWATPLGAWIAAGSSLGVAVLIAYWDVFFPGANGPSFTWMMPLSLLAGMIAGSVGSLIRLPVGAGVHPPEATAADG